MKHHNVITVSCQMECKAMAMAMGLLIPIYFLSLALLAAGQILMINDLTRVEGRLVVSMIGVGQGEK